MPRGQLTYNPTQRFIKEMERHGRSVTEAEKTVLFAIQNGDPLPTDIFSERNAETVKIRLAAIEAERARLLNL